MHDIIEYENAVNIVEVLGSRWNNAFGSAVFESSTDYRIVTGTLIGDENATGCALHSRVGRTRSPVFGLAFGAIVQIIVSKNDVFAVLVVVIRTVIMQNVVKCFSINGILVIKPFPPGKTNPTMVYPEMAAAQ